MESAVAVQAVPFRSGIASRINFMTHQSFSEFPSPLPHTPPCKSIRVGLGNIIEHVKTKKSQILFPKKIFDLHLN